MFASRIRRTGGLAALLMVMALFGLGACDTVRDGTPDQAQTRAQAPGIHFHNDIVMFGAIGGGSGSR